MGMASTLASNIIAEHLSARLLILQCVFLVGGVWHWLPSRFRNAICHALGMQLKVWLVHKHPSRLGMQLKHPVYKRLCTLTQVYHSQRCSSASGLIVLLSKWQKLWWEQGKARSLVRKWKRRQSVAHASLIPRLAHAPPTHKPGNEAMHMHDRKACVMPTN